MNPGLLATGTLAGREIVRFLRQRSRVMSAVGQPVIFWILFGAGFGTIQVGQTDAATGMSFQEYFLPGVAVLIVLFTSIFSSITVIQDRNEGFLQGVLAAPVPRWAIVLGKVLGGTALALLQAALFLLAAPLLQFAGLAPDLNLSLTAGSVLGAALFLTLISVGLTALGYLFAWKIDSVQGYHGVMSVVLLPMWLLSGAFFPGTGSPWMQWVIAANPLTYGVAGLRRCLSTGSGAIENLPSLGVSLAVTAAFAAVCLAIDIQVTRKDPAVN